MINNILSSTSPALWIFVILAGIVLLVLFLATNSNSKNDINKIKRKTVGDNQYGSQRWATKAEKSRAFVRVKYEPQLWRKGISLPTIEGYIVDFEITKRGAFALVDTSDSHVFNCAGPGGGKTTTLLYAQIEYALACGMSFINTDSKGDILRMFAPIAEECYGYKNLVLNFKNPSTSDPFNMIQLINKYTDIYKNTGDLSAKAAAERYSRALAEGLVNADNFGAGQNTYFYEAAEGVITSIIQLVAEFLPDNERHIVTVFTIIQQLMREGKNPNAATKGKVPYSKFMELMDKLPNDHKAKWSAGAALNPGGNRDSNTFASVMQTAMSRLLSFIDSESEQIVCFNSPIDIEYICSQKAAVFIVFSEADKTKHKLVSMILSQLYSEALKYVELNHADTNRLPRRLYFYEDEFGIYPKQSNVTGILAGSRSYNILLSLFVQSIHQPTEKYGRDGVQNILSCCQLAFGGGFAPMTDDADMFSKTLGSQTISTGSVTNSSGKHGDGRSRNISMTKRDIMLPDELKRLPFGKWVCVKKSFHPFISNMPRYADIGITPGSPYIASKNDLERVYYGDADHLIGMIAEKYQAVTLSENEWEELYEFCPPGEKLPEEVTFDPTMY